MTDHPLLSSPAPGSPISVLLARKISFSAGLRLYNNGWNQVKNKELYGKAVNPHGAEFYLEVAFGGPISPIDGMIVDLAEVKPQLSKAVALLEDSFLDRDIDFFGRRVPTAENIALYLWNEIPRQIGQGILHHISLQQMPRVCVDLSANSMKISRSYEFAAAHRLFAPALSDEENLDKFGRCSNPAGHGHNFQLHVWIEGVPDAQTGFIINPRILDAIVDEEVYQRFDHKHLNEDCPEFIGTGIVPTSENLALAIFDILNRKLLSQGYRLARIGLRETQKNYFEVEA